MSDLPLTTTNTYQEDVVVLQPLALNEEGLLRGIKWSRGCGKVYIFEMVEDEG